MGKLQSVRKSLVSNERKMKQHDDEDDLPSAPAWMITYGDMMTLLMTFFILIMSFSTVELDKFKAALGSLKGAFGVLGDSKELKTEANYFSPYHMVIKKKSVYEFVENLREMIADHELEKEIDVYLSGTEVIITMKDHILFESGKADLRPEVLPILSEIARKIVSKASEVKVGGHTDNLPIHTTNYASNWELSQDRALSVIKHFVYHDGINPAKLAAVGFSEYRPLVPNTTPENRARNRRVEINLKW